MKTSLARPGKTIILTGNQKFSGIRITETKCRGLEDLMEYRKVEVVDRLRVFIVKTRSAARDADSRGNALLTMNLRATSYYSSAYCFFTCRVRRMMIAEE